MMIVKFTPDDGRRVYSAPVTLRVVCTLYVLADSDEHAQRLVKRTDLEDYFSFDADSLSTDGERLLKINDVFWHIHSGHVDPNIVDITELSTAEYPPNEHPDFVGEPHK